MNSLPEQVARLIQQQKLFAAGERILVAVSGGLDSMVLGTVLRELAPRFGWRLRVAHFNHQLRGRASAGDERFVARWAQRYQLPFYSGRGDVAGLAARSGLSLEMAARQLRHEFLARTARRFKCPTIALAHHADDQVELFFLRLLRGAGGEGLGGMQPVAPSPADARVRLVRPLLTVDRAHLEIFGTEQRLKFRVDTSNTSREILRNRVRLDLLPWLRQQFQPALNRIVPRVMELIGDDAEHVGGAAREWLESASARAPWAGLSRALQRRIIQQQLQQLRVAVDFDLVERLRLAPDQAVSIGDRWIKRERTGKFQLLTRVAAAFNPAERVVKLLPRGSVTFGALRIDWKLASRVKVKDKPEATELLDAARVGRQIVLRHWRPGDRFQPLGMKTAVKLQDWFVNQKISQARRHELVLATTPSGVIFWVEGLRLGAVARLTSATTQTLVWSWRR
ncbi:MAG: tRNA lysidine(34) synthetase TilS [Verrucomicrobiae bacterium]|nr:tRNA lysidine(34) synthetase TilS [Verrucomicrobiae bacterium]